MKTIELTDEMYDKLIELSTEMKTQDNRYTAMPFMFQVETTEQVAAYEGCGDSIWVHPEGETELKSDDEIREYVFKHLSKENTPEKAKSILDDMDEYECEEWLEEHEFYQVQVTTENRYQNTFFTARACQAHIDSNSYHYNKPRVYLNHAWRNPEMNLITEFLCVITPEVETFSH